MASPARCGHPLPCTIQWMMWTACLPVWKKPGTFCCNCFFATEYSMSVETYEVGTAGKVAPSVTVTEAAAQHLHQQLAPKGLTGVRIHLEKSGCTGYKYVIDEVAGPEADDL